MSIVDAPFIGIAVPEQYSPISKAYWQTDASVKEIATRFNLSSDKKVTKRAGGAKLLGVHCKYCGKDMVVPNRCEAILVLNSDRSNASCTPCYREAQLKRIKGRSIRKPSAPKPEKAPSSKVREEFYASWEWLKLRMEVIKEFGRACQCCGATPGMKYASGEPVRVVVDHIKPISKFWHLRLQRSNLQVLCDECNMGKGNWDETDFRPPAAPDEWIVEDDGIPQSIRDQLGTLQ